MLLLSSYREACEASYDAAEITSENASRLLSRNEELWPWGSYKALECRMDELRVQDRAVYRSTWLRWVVNTQAHEGRAQAGLTWLEKSMPRTIYVPLVVAENAGFGRGEAKEYARRTDPSHERKHSPI